MMTVGQSYFDWELGNPLLKGSPGPLTHLELGQQLAYDPRAKWGGLLPPQHQRFGQSYEIKEFFFPQFQHIDAAMRVLAIHTMAMKQLDPRIPMNRAALYDRGRFKGKELKDIPWFSGGAMGGVLEAITGEGKTIFGDRLCSLFEHQVVHHVASEEYGWVDFKQLMYLRVFMPAGAGRAGFLLEAAKEMDRLLDTDYATELTARGTTIEKQLVLLLIWLSLHRCGLLIIEEAQDRVIGSIDFGSDFLFFFLKVLNWGIPLLLIGNPSAMKVVRTFSQDRRRLSDGVWCTLEPITFWNSSEWRDDLVANVWSWTVLPEPDEPIPDLPKYLWSLTGGCRSALARLRRESLLAAAFDGALSVSKKHVEAGYRSQSYIEMHPMINAFVQKNPKLLEQFIDIPRDHFAAKWTLERAVQKARDDALKKAAQEKAEDAARMALEAERLASADAVAGASRTADQSPPVQADAPINADQSAAPPARKGRARTAKAPTFADEPPVEPPGKPEAPSDPDDFEQTVDDTTAAIPQPPGPPPAQPVARFRGLFRAPPKEGSN